MAAEANNKLVLAILQGDDYADTVSELTSNGFFVTLLNTTGGFLRAGNTTLISGVEDERLDEALAIIEKLCKVGDIYIVADTQRNVLEDIQDPYFIYGRLQKIANDIKSDILYPNAKRPGTNPGYKTSYKPKKKKKGIH